MCLCTHNPCTFWAPGFPWLTTAKSLFQALSPAWQRIRCSSTESKQPPFRGSKHFATCYFSLIYYEHIFPFIRGFANSPESQNLVVPLLPPLPLQGDPGGLHPALFPSATGGWRSLALSPALSQGDPRWEIRCEQLCWVVDQSEEKFPLGSVCPSVSWRSFGARCYRNG